MRWGAFAASIEGLPNFGALWSLCKTILSQTNPRRKTTEDFCVVYKVRVRAIAIWSGGSRVPHVPCMMPAWEPSPIPKRRLILHATTGTREAHSLGQDMHAGKATLNEDHHLWEILSTLTLALQASYFHFRPESSAVLGPGKHIQAPLTMNRPYARQGQSSNPGLSVPVNRVRVFSRVVGRTIKCRRLRRCIQTDGAVGISGFGISRDSSMPIT